MRLFSNACEEPGPYTHKIVFLGKNEVTIEFHRNDDAKVALMEMRFFVPAYQDENAEDPVKVRWNMFFVSYT